MKICCHAPIDLFVTMLCLISMTLQILFQTVAKKQMTKHVPELIEFEVDKYVQVFQLNF